MSHLTERVPPHNDEAEQAVLGSILREPAKLDDVLMILRPSDFYQDAARRCYEAMIDLHHLGIVPDVKTLGQRFHERNEVADVGGYGYLSGLFDATPTSANAVFYAKQVRADSILRQLIHTGGEIVRDAYDRIYPADDALARAERLIFGIREGMCDDLEVVTLGQACFEVSDHVEEVLQGKVFGIPTGWTDLDHLTRLYNGRLVVIAARPSVGKSLVGGQLLLVAADTGKHCLFVSLEMKRRQIASRMIAAYGGVNHRAVSGARRITEQEHGEMMKTINHLAGLHYSICDRFDMNVSRIAAVARRLKRRGGLDLMVVDYLQLIDCAFERGQTRAEALGVVSRGLKGLAKDLDIPVVALCQLNRQSEGTTEKEPELHHIKESGSIEQDADDVWLMWRAGEDPTTPDYQLINVKVAKQRDGPCGRTVLLHNKPLMRLENYAGPAPA
jgi:replicative DNA helicase